MGEKKGKIEWESFDTTNIFIPKEILSYHLYLLELYKKNKKIKEEKRELEFIANFLKNEENEVEDAVCIK